MSNLPLGASTWCFTGKLPPELNDFIDGQKPLLPEYVQPIRAYFTELADTVLDSEIKSIEVWFGSAIRDEYVIAQLKRLADTGRIFSAHTPFGEQLDLSSLDNEIRRSGVNACILTADLLSKLGGKTLVVHSSPYFDDLSERPQRLARCAESIAEIADYCRGLGISVAVELLAGTRLGNTGQELLSLLEAVDRPNVGVCLDVNHVFPADDLIPAVRLLGTHIITLHISDYDGIEEKHWLPTQGVIDWAGLVRALREVGYSGPFMYEMYMEAGVGEMASLLEENYRKIMMGRGVRRDGVTPESDLSDLSDESD